MRSTGIFLLGLLVVFPWVPAWAEYQAKGKRDPFVPLISADGQRVHPPGSEDEANPGQGSFVLQGIMFDPKAESYAIFSGHVVREKEEFAGMKVLKIEPNGVTIWVDGQRRRLTLHQPGEESKTE